MGRERTEGERLAARAFEDVVRTEAERFFDSMMEEIRRNPEVLRARPSTALSEEGADRLALSAVHRAREESPKEAEEPPPAEDEVRSWVGECRRRERGSGRPGT